MALRAELKTRDTVSAHDVPTMMCQILQQLVQDQNTVRLIRYKNNTFMVIVCWDRDRMPKC
jgi:hypothetical protein